MDTIRIHDSSICTQQDIIFSYSIRCKFQYTTKYIIAYYVISRNPSPPKFPTNLPGR